MTLDIILSNKSNYKGVVIDTNLLLLLLIGLYDITQIEKHKRIKKYSKSDYDKLLILIRHFSDKIFTTTNIVTEVCNLSDNYNTETEYCFFQFIEKVLKTYEEQNEKSIDLIDSNKTAFYKLGIADTSII